LVRFLTDDPKQLKKYENSRRNPNIAVPTAREITANMSQPMLELVNDWTAGQTLPPTLDGYLESLARQYGNVSKRELLGILTGR
jgi:hypothetical protein